MPVRSRGGSALPEDLLRAVYSIARVITLKDRLRGLAVCRAWRKALSGMPILHFDVYSPDKEEEKRIWRWATLAQPCVIELFLSSAQELAIQAIHSLQRKELRQLWWMGDALDLPRALPEPAIFPNLQQVVVHQYIHDADWLAGLGALKNLEILMLYIQQGPPPAPAPVRLPPLLRLASLELTLLPDTEVQLQLAGLPALTELCLEGEEGRAALLASEPAPQLQRMVCRVGHLSVDFSALPGLTCAALIARQQLDKAANLAAATALTCLELEDWQGRRGGEWALELLQELPPTLSCLHLHGEWPPEAAALVGAMPHLRALGLDSWATHETPLPPVSAPVWKGLRAFSWSTCTQTEWKRLNLPEGLRQASQLEALQAWLLQSNMQDVELITSLPGLRKIVIVHDGEDLNNPHCTAARSILQRAMPRIALVEREMLESVDFFEWAFS